MPLGHGNQAVSIESAEEKWEYIREDPVREGLVSHWSDWPYRIGFEL
jgi:hypothetical protein